MVERPECQIAPVREDLLNLIAMLGAVVLVIPVTAQAIAGLLTGININNVSGLTKNSGVLGWQIPIAVLCQQLMIGGLATWRLRSCLRYSWAELGLRLHSLRAQLTLGCWYGVVLLSINVTGFALVSWVAAVLWGKEHSLHLFYNEQETLMGLLKAGSTNIPALLVLLSAVAIIAPVAEELFFRGYIYNTFKRIVGRGAARWGASNWGAIVFSSLIFTGVHFYTWQAPVVFVLSVALTVLYEKRGSLLVCMSAHGFMNSLVALYVISS